MIPLSRIKHQPPEFEWQNPGLESETWATTHLLFVRFIRDALPDRIAV
jgi:hypothetical protein